jgi:thiosulfate/3-mercaptopyruvate sulfurtransferase
LLFSNRVKDPLIETAWLEAHLDDPGIRIVDTRWRGDGSARDLYRLGHIPGAVHLDWHLDLNHTREGIRDLLLPPDKFADVMAEAGIGDETHVVAYRDEILQALQDPHSKTAIVDTRPPEQHAGQAVWTPPGRLYIPKGHSWVAAGGRLLRGGRIPGAISLPSSGNLDPGDWTFLSAEQLRARAMDAGLSYRQRVITYCGVGISASLGLFALHLAGFMDLALYDASWEEWGHDPDLPIERD